MKKENMFTENVVFVKEFLNSVGYYSLINLLKPDCRFNPWTGVLRNGENYYCFWTDHRGFCYIESRGGRHVWCPDPCRANKTMAQVDHGPRYRAAKLAKEMMEFHH